jgi:CRP-like cAMP-binding protein
MVDKSILRPIRFFEELSDEMLESIAAIAELRVYDSDVYLNKRKRSADYFYIILEGEVSLQIESISGKTVRLETIGAGGAIGFSSLVESEKQEYLSDAKTLIPTKLIRFRNDELMLLFYQNFELGFLIMKKIAYIAKRRLTYRTYPIPMI